MPGRFESPEDRASKGYDDAEQLAKTRGTAGSLGDGGDCWRKLEGVFVAVNIFNTAWAASDVHLCPHAERGGGAVDISIIRGGPSVTRLKLVQVVQRGRVW